MRYRDLIDIPEGQNAPSFAQKQAKERQQKVKANQALDASRRAQSDAVRRLHDDQAKAAQNDDPGRASVSRSSSAAA